jgi:CubicO group peptidase (beta-lactamase class C family)
MRSPIARTVVVSIALVVPGSGAAGADDADVLVEAEMKAQRIPGLSLAVVKDGKVIKAKGYGLANLEVSARSAPETVYELGIGDETVHGHGDRRRW